MYAAKVCNTERNKGCGDLESKQIEMVGQLPDGFVSEYGNIRNTPLPKNNIHPTLKPISLLRKLAKLFKLPDIVEQTIYFPFAGSGSELISFALENYTLRI